MNVISPVALKDVSSFNEAEVRFHIIDPIIQCLGYTKNEDLFVKLEEKLQYPYYHIGRKSKKKDLPLGFPDYRAGLKDARGSFIVEAKAATVKLSQADVEQAHSYAAHAQVGANYFVICNGKILVVYETLSGPMPSPILSMPVDEVNKRYHEIESILGPKNLAVNCTVSYDTGLKLCDGLGSSAKIQSGSYDLDKWVYQIILNGVECTQEIKAAAPEVSSIDDQLNLLQENFDFCVSSGLASRDDTGRVQVDMHFSGVTRGSSLSMQLLGLDRITFHTNEKFISTDVRNPSKLQATTNFSIDKGTMFPQLFGAAVPFDLNLKGDVLIIAEMYYDSAHVYGKYAAYADYWYTLPAVESLKIEAEFFGSVMLEINAA